MNDNNTSPDMVRFSAVISVITENASCYKSEKDMAKVIRAINALTKYDLKPVSDTNYQTTINLVDGRSEVRHLIDKIKQSVNGGEE